MAQQLTADRLLRVGETQQIQFDYQVEGDALLGDSETISTSTWSAPSNTTEASESETDTVATIFLTGDSAGTGKLTNTITTSSGRTLERSIVVRVES